MAEMRRLRILLDSKEAKYRHWKKIKSKGFHRRLNRAKRKHLIKEFEQLQQTDPQAAQEKLEELERSRILVCERTWHIALKCARSHIH